MAKPAFLASYLMHFYENSRLLELHGLKCLEKLEILSCIFFIIKQYFMLLKLNEIVSKLHFLWVSGHLNALPNDLPRNKLFCHFNSIRTSENINSNKKNYNMMYHFITGGLRY